MNKTKICSCCLEEKQESEFSKTDISGRLRAACKKCDYKREKTRKQEKKGIHMNEGRFKSIYNNLSSIHKKVFDVVPESAYWSPARVANELSIKGVKHDISTVTGCLNQLLEKGIVIEAQRGMFSREKVTKTVVKPIETKQTEIQMVTKEKKNPVDALREVAIKFLDFAKEVDLIVDDIEKVITENSQDTAKLKQLQSLLKGIG